MSAIWENVVIEMDGVLELRSPQLHAGDTAEVVVRIKPAQAKPNAESVSVPSWYRFIGCLDGGDPHGSDNEAIDRDLAASYLDKHEPAK